MSTMHSKKTMNMPLILIYEDGDETEWEDVVANAYADEESEAEEEY